MNLPTVVIFKGEELLFWLSDIGRSNGGMSKISELIIPRSNGELEVELLGGGASATLFNKKEEER